MDENIRYRLSRWCKVFEKGDVLALYHSLTLGLVFLGKECKEKLQSLEDNPMGEILISNELGNDVLDLLKKDKLIVEENEDDLLLLDDIRNEMLAEEGLSMVYLLLTDGCNLKCRYCFEDTPKARRDFIPQMMSPERTQNAMLYFARLLKKYGAKKKRATVHLYGGEPMLNPKAVRVAVLSAQKLKKERMLPGDCEIAIVTNGTLIDEDAASFFAKNKVTVGLSLDGPRQINNAYRIPRIGEFDVYEKVVKSYQILKKCGVKIGFSSTLSPAVVDNFDVVLDFFLNGIGIQDGISFNILHYNPAVKVGKEYFNKAAKSFISAFEVFREENIYEERMMRKAKAFAYRIPMLSDCGVNGRQIVIAPDGRVGVCQDFIKPRKYFGDDFQGGYDPFEAGLFTGWRKRSPLFMEQCYDCEAVAICGGGCPASAELQTGNRWNIDARICPHSKMSLEWLVWDTYKKIA